MNVLQKLNIKEKMILGYLPVFLVIISIAVYSLQSLTKFERINEEIVEQDNFLIQTVDKITDNIIDQEAYARRYIILGSPQMLELFWQRISAFNFLVEQLRKSHGTKNTPLEQLVVVQKEFIELYTENFRFQSHPPSTLTINDDKKIQDRFDKMLKLIPQVGDIVRQNQQQKMKSAKDIVIKSFRTISLLSVFAFAVGFFSATLITRSLSSSIQKLIFSTKMISQGIFDHLPHVKNKDELGELAQSFGKMTKQLARLEERYLDSNPLSRLPGGRSIENFLKDYIAAGKSVAFLILDLDNFKAFNDRYGYAAGNNVITSTAKLIDSTVKKQGEVESFVGHIGGDDFAVLISPTHYESTCKTIIQEFDQMILDFYNAEDREKGYIAGRTRQGQEIKYPIMSISIAVVSSEGITPLNHIRIAEIAAELKEHAKSIPGSAFVVNRRDKSSKKSGFRPKVIRKLTA